MLERERLRVRTGETVEVVRYRPTEPAPEWVRSLYEMIVRPFDPWISAVEMAFLRRMLRGEFAETNADLSYSVWIEGQPASHAAILIARDLPQVGLVSFVITEPDFRGRGLCHLLMERLIDDFWAAGGLYAFLGTNNPAARAIYERVGFQGYRGHVMRYVAGEEGKDLANVDHAYFSYDGPAMIRAGTWGDVARLAWLYVAPGSWFIKDYLEALYDHPAVEPTRCGSIVPSMMRNVEERAGGLWVLETKQKRAVGAATMGFFDRVGQRNAAVVDFFVTPAYKSYAAKLLHVAVGGAEVAGARVARCFLASCDRDKEAIVQSAGFACEATLARQFGVGEEFFDLKIYTLTL